MAVLGVALLLALGAAGHLYRTSQAWQGRSDEYLQASRDLGEDLAVTRQDLQGAQAELQAVRAQLTTAQERIVELADEKAQLGDDAEVQRQLVDYQERVSDAAGKVALALDTCVQRQLDLIAYLEKAAQEVSSTHPYDPKPVEQYRAEVEALCQTASEANIALQRELAR